MGAANVIPPSFPDFFPPSSFISLSFFYFRAFCPFLFTFFLPCFPLTLVLLAFFLSLYLSSFLCFLSCFLAFHFFLFTRFFLHIFLTLFLPVLSLLILSVYLSFSLLLRFFFSFFPIWQESFNLDNFFLQFLPAGIVQ